MSELNDQIERLKRSNRRWKTLAATACLALALVTLGNMLAMSRAKLQAEHAARELHRIAAAALQDANSARP